MLCRVLAAAAVGQGVAALYALQPVGLEQERELVVETAAGRGFHVRTLPAPAALTRSDTSEGRQSVGATLGGVPASHEVLSVNLPGLSEGKRFRCAACGNLTRFDVETVERVRRYWHVALSGEGVAEEEERLEASVESVMCRWCGSRGDVEIVDAPASQAGEATGGP